MTIIKDLYDIYKDYISVEISKWPPNPDPTIAMRKAKKEQKRRRLIFFFVFLPVSWSILAITLWILYSFATNLINAV